MPRAQEARLRDALEDYVGAYRGDGRGRTRTGVIPGDELVPVARELLDKMGGSQNISRGDTPGRRAAGSTGQGAPNFDPSLAQGLTE
jgi:hypothetical protein